MFAVLIAVGIGLLNVTQVAAVDEHQLWNHPHLADLGGGEHDSVSNHHACERNVLFAQHAIPSRALLGNVLVNSVSGQMQHFVLFRKKRRHHLLGSGPDQRIMVHCEPVLDKDLVYAGSFLLRARQWGKTADRVADDQGPILRCGAPIRPRVLNIQLPDQPVPDRERTIGMGTPGVFQHLPRVTGGAMIE